MRSLSILLLLTTLGWAAPAHWDGLIEHAPANPAQADALSLRLNQAYLLEAQRLGGPAWWLESVRAHVRENLKAAGEHPEAPPLSASGRAFIADYTAEQQRLAKIQNRYPSEVRWSRDETAGWEQPDRTFQLTFDDGPRPGTSQTILARLRKHGLPATFFVLGKQLAAGKPPDYSGFTVASHSFNHANLLELSATALSAEFSDTQKQAARSGLKLAPLFRAPYGSRSDRELLLMKKLGLRSVLWNVDSQDWQADMQARPGRIASRTLALMLLHRRGIVLMHDVQPKTPDELARLLPLLTRLDIHIAP